MGEALFAVDGDGGGLLAVGGLDGAAIGQHDLFRVGHVVDIVLGSVAAVEAEAHLVVITAVIARALVAPGREQRLALDVEGFAVLQQHLEAGGLVDAGAGDELDVVLDIADADFLAAAQHVAVLHEQLALAVFLPLHLAGHGGRAEGEPDEELAEGDGFGGGGNEGVGLVAADAGADAPRMVAGAVPVADVDALAGDPEPAVEAADLVEAAVILLQPAIDAAQVMGFLMGGGEAGEGDVGLDRLTFRGREGEAQDLQRLDDLELQRADGQVAEARDEGAREAGVVLPAVLLDADEALEGVHVLVGGHAADELDVLGAMAAKPHAVKEAVVAGQGMVEGDRTLMHQGFVEFAQHGWFPLSCPARGALLRLERASILRGGETISRGTCAS
jgi:hypothetical protein